MRNKRYIVLPACLLIYGLAMAAFFAKEHIAEGRGWILAAIVGADILICVLLAIFLYKKQNL